jgi:hypothetical protein
MGSINPTRVGLPTTMAGPTGATPHAGLSQESVQTLLQAGVGIETIHVADDIVASTLARMLQEHARPATTPDASGIPSAAPSTPDATTIPTAEPNSLDAADPTYPQLTVAHVMVLRAVKTPEAAIAQLAAGNPGPQEMDAWIRMELMQAPEAWDQLVGNPVGTARSGLLELLPGVQLPAPGAGNPQLPVVPGVGTPTVPTPYENGKNDLMRHVVIAGGLGLAAFAGFRFLKSKSAQQAAAAAASAAGGGAVASPATEAVARTLGMAADVGTGAGIAMHGNAGGQLASGLGAADLTSTLIMHGRPSQAWQLANGMLPGLEHSGQAMNMAAHWNLPADVALRQARFELAASTGQLLEGALWEHGSAVAGAVGAVGRRAPAGGSGAAASAVEGAGSLSQLLDGDRAAKLAKLLDLM